MTIISYDLSREPASPSLFLTFLQVFLQASASCVQLLLRQGKRPFSRQLGKSKVSKLPLQVLVQNHKLPVTLGAQLSACHVHIIHLEELKLNNYNEKAGS